MFVLRSIYYICRCRTCCKDGRIGESDSSGKGRGRGQNHWQGDCCWGSMEEEKEGKITKRETRGGGGGGRLVKGRTGREKSGL